MITDKDIIYQDPVLGVIIQLSDIHTNNRKAFQERDQDGLFPGKASSSCELVTLCFHTAICAASHT